jgi:hypothetical protein
VPLYPPPVYKYTPSFMVFAGHSFFNRAGGIFDQSYRLDQAAQALMGLPREAVILRALSGAALCKDGLSNYGYANFLQNSPRTNTAAPYVGNSGAYCFCYGINDMGLLIPSSDYPAATIQAQVKTALQHTWRTLISRARASTIFECGGTDESAKWAFGAGMANTTSNLVNSGGGYRSATSTTNANATFTIPSDFPGGTIAVGFLGAYGTASQAGAGGTWTVTGTFSGSGGANIVTSNLMPVASANRSHYIRRFTNLPSSDAGKTMIFTATVVDASGTVGIDYAQIEATTDIPLVVMCNISRVLSAATYVSNWAGSYWTNASNLGATGDADVATFNTALASVVAEFDSLVVIADIDKALAKSASLLNTDGLHPNQAGCLTGGQAIWNAIVTAPTSYNNLVPDWRITGGDRRPRVSQCWYGPEIYNAITSTVTMVSQTMYLYPIVVSEANEVWDQVSFEVTTAATGGSPTVHLGLYADEGWSGRPQTSIFDWGSTAITSTGVKTQAISGVTLDPGLYWLAFDLELQGSTVVGAVRGFTGMVPLLPQTNAGSAPTIGTWVGNTAYKMTGVNTGFGFLPGDVASSTPTVVATAAPWMLIRRK